jgi:hypothetical protein
MTTCPECFFDYPDERGSCPRCDARAAREPRAPTAAAAARDEALADQLAALRSEALPTAAPATESKPSPPPAAPAPLAFQAPEPELETPTLPEPAEPPPPSSLSPRGGDQEEDISDERLEELRKEGGFIVGLLGFPTAGKTWFLNRLKHSLHEQRGYNCIPEAEPNGADVPRTFAVTAHHFQRDGDAFVLLDIPGERFETALRRKFVQDKKLLLAMRACKALIVTLPADETLLSRRASQLYPPAYPADEGSDELDLGLEAASRRRELETQLADHAAELRSLEAAVRVARRNAKREPDSEEAIEAVRAAEDARAARKAELEALRAKLADKDAWQLSDTDARLTRFTAGIGRMAGVMSLLENGSQPDAMIDYDDDAVAAHMRSAQFRKCAKPTFVALAKADVLERQSPVTRAMINQLFKGRDADKQLLQDFDVDPLETVKRFRPALVANFEQWFRWCKFDFLTAFGGHGGGTRINYACEERGVAPVIAWMLWAAQSANWSERQWRDVDRARRLRRLRDGPNRRNGLLQRIGTSGG